MTDPRPPDSRPLPGEQPPQAVRRTLDQPPGERYGAGAAPEGSETGIVGGPWAPVAVVVGGAIAYTILGGILLATAGLIVVAAFIGWLIGKLVSPPARAAAAGVAAVLVGLLAIWAFGRVEGGVLDPIAYLDAVQGWPLVALQLLAGGGVAAAASRSRDDE